MKGGNSTYSKLTKYLLTVLLILLVIAIIYFCMASVYRSNSKTISEMEKREVEKLIEQFNAPIDNGVVNGGNNVKILVVYTASWCPYCRDFMGMADENSPISEDSEFAKTRKELGNLFEHVKHTDENCKERMNAHGITGYPGLAFVDKNSDIGVPLGNTQRTATSICKTFNALRS